MQVGQRTADNQPFAIGVLNVKPDDIVGDVMLIKASIYSQRVCLVTVVPAALVISAGVQQHILIARPCSMSS
jgi:hypothetical protein